MPRLLIPIILLFAFAGELAAQWKQPDQIHLTADGHQELARLLLPFVIKALTHPTAPETDT
jgi:lysophospholipase L1-like esterase